MTQPKSSEADGQHNRVLIESHGEWDWLPQTKLSEMSLSPYTTKGRVYEAASDHVLPIAALFLTAELSRQGGWLEYYWTGDNSGKMQDLFWRFGDAMADVATSNSPNEAIWKLGVSNIDIFRNGTGGWKDRLLYGAKKTVAYLPFFYSALPETLWELGIIGPGSAVIDIEPDYLKQYISLEVRSALSERNQGTPPFAYIDLDILSGAPIDHEPGSSYEQALQQLNDSCRANGINRIRFYGAVEKGRELSLYLQFYSGNRPSQLIKFPASFGSPKEADWWTRALDSRTFHGVYNDRDQYRVVQSWNNLWGYNRPLMNPLSESIIAYIPELIEVMAMSERLEVHTTYWKKHQWMFVAPDLAGDIEDGSELAVQAIPLQSKLHTLVSNGSSGGFFFDDHKSRRAEWSKITLLTQVDVSQIHKTNLVSMESHLPWLPVRGGARIAKQFATNYTYSLMAKAFFNWRLHAPKKSSFAKHVRAELDDAEDEEWRRQQKQSNSNTTTSIYPTEGELAQVAKGDAAVHQAPPLPLPLP
ncbi:hypothetical protein [Parendozoicomonas sp. Alg238-R29]|uniref:hypothetical protein n=1 Tax=Parendozoicomonas sp. Alg238-R29 TaxID=2993446 RepID=UPI00248F1EC3|nr:hypothetical protein [Parendozoicomonas sp. Alg238-R29]